MLCSHVIDSGTWQSACFCVAMQWGRNKCFTMHRFSKYIALVRCCQISKTSVVCSAEADNPLWSSISGLATLKTLQPSVLLKVLCLASKLSLVVMEAVNLFCTSTRERKEVRIGHYPDGFSAICKAFWFSLLHPVLLGCPFSVYALGRPFFKHIANLVQMSFCMKIACKIFHKFEIFVTQCNDLLHILVEMRLKRPVVEQEHRP